MREHPLHKKYHLLIVDDEEAIRDMVEFSLDKYHLKVDGVPDCASATRYLAHRQPDLILLDWMLPDNSGIEYAKQLRQHSELSAIPIVMLTAKAEEANKIRGLDEAMVDDYVTKPFSPKELAARIRAVLRRVPPTKKSLQLECLQLDFDNRRVTINQTPLSLTAKQFKLLHFFMANTNKVYTRQQLVDALNSDNSFIDERSIDRQVKRLRDVLQAHGYDGYIKTVRGHGYQMVSKL